LIREWLTAGISEEDEWLQSIVGTSQGAVIAPPTKVQNFLLSSFASFLRKEGEVDPVDDSNLVQFHHDLVNQRPQDLAPQCPIGGLQVRADRRAEAV